MKADTFHFETPSGMPIHTYRWLPEENLPIRAVIQIAHGMAEHAERYANTAQVLTSHGYAVYANDHRGHGYTANKPEDIGYFAPNHGWLEVTKDMHTLTDIIKEAHPGIPVYILGHSMGSLLTRTYICLYPNAVNGVILSGTAGNPGLVRPVAQLIVFLSKIFRGSRARVKLLDNMSFGSFNNRIKKPKTRFDWLSVNTSNVENYISDPLCGQLFTVSFFGDLLYGLGFIFNRNNIRRIPINLPMLFISGNEDPVGDFGKGVQQSFALYRKCGLLNTEIKLYKGLRHEILNETNNDIVILDILSWLDKQK